MSDEHDTTPYVEVRHNGPIVVYGHIPIRRPDGTLLRQARKVSLCRCGHSATKPFCDGAHKRVGFAAD